MPAPTLKLKSSGLDSIVQKKYKELFGLQFVENDDS